MMKEDKLPEWLIHIGDLEVAGFYIQNFEKLSHKKYKAISDNQIYSVQAKFLKRIYHGKNYTKHKERLFNCVDWNYCSSCGKNNYTKAYQFTNYFLEVLKLYKNMNGTQQQQYKQWRFKKFMNSSNHKTTTIIPNFYDIFNNLNDIKTLKQSEKDQIKYLEKHVHLIDDVPCLLTIYTEETRLTAHQQSLQNVTKNVRDHLLNGTGYCDLDAKQSYQYDILNYWMPQYRTVLTQPEITNLEWMMDRQKVFECMDQALIKKDIEKMEKKKGYSGTSSDFMKEINLSMIFSGKKYQKYMSKEDQNKVEVAQIALEKLAQTDAIIYGSDKPVEKWKNLKWRKDWSSHLANMLGRSEQEKIGWYVEEYSKLGYVNQCYIYDGFILNKEPSVDHIEQLNNKFNDEMWFSPMVVKKVWN